MHDMDALFAALSRSTFRRRFHLRPAEQRYLTSKGLAAVLRHAEHLIARRLAPAQPPNDGRQTPFRGHPVFVAQHATATCCRGCLRKWHHIPKGQELSAEQQRYVVQVIERWLQTECATAEGGTEEPSLFGNS